MFVSGMGDVSANGGSFVEDPALDIQVTRIPSIL